MKLIIIFTIMVLIVFVSGYALGRREGKKEGHAEAQISFNLIMREKAIEYLNEHTDSQILKLNENYGNIHKRDKSKEGDI